MRIEEKTVTLKDGSTCLVRSAVPDDAPGMLALLQKTAEETEFLARCPEDPLMSEEAERVFLQKMLDSPNQVMVIAEAEGQIIASASVFANSQRIKLRHRAIFGISVRKAFWHLGLGRLMTEECIRLARQMGYEQLELQVLAGNTRARLLYERAGFELWGCIKNGFKMQDGSYQDDVLMGLMLRDIQNHNLQNYDSANDG